MTAIVWALMITSAILGAAMAMFPPQRARQGIVIWLVVAAMMTAAGTIIMRM